MVKKYEFLLSLKPSKKEIDDTDTHLNHKVMPSAAFYIVVLAIVLPSVVATFNNTPKSFNNLGNFLPTYISGEWSKRRP